MEEEIGLNSKYCMVKRELIAEGKGGQPRPVDGKLLRGNSWGEGGFWLTDLMEFLQKKGER